MESFDCFTKESITFMHSHGVLEPLIKIVLTKSCIEQITLNKNAEEGAIKDFQNSAGIQDEVSFQNWLKKNNLEKEEFKKAALEDIRKSRFAHYKFGNKVDKKFLERKKDLDIVIYSLVRVLDPYLAREIYLRLADKEASFGELASLYSQGMESKTRGVIGPIELGKTHPKLIEVLKSSTPGVVQPPTEIEGLFCVTRLESLDESKLDKFMRKNMENELFNEWIESESKTLLSNILNQQKPEKLSE